MLKNYIDELHLKIKNHLPVTFTEVEKRNVIKEWDESGFDEFRKKVIWRETFKA